MPYEDDIRNESTTSTVVWTHQLGHVRRSGSDDLVRWGDLMR